MPRLIPIPQEKIYVGLIGYVFFNLRDNYDKDIPVLCEVVDTHNRDDKIEIIVIGGDHTRLWIYATAIYKQVASF